MPDWNGIANVAGDAGFAIDPATARGVGGGSINSGWQVRGADARYFIKTNRRDTIAMFDAEIEGLNELAEAKAVRVPRPLLAGQTGSDAFLMLEYIGLTRGGGQTAARLGEQLAAQHRRTAEEFGWCRENTIGSTPQLNEPDDSWVRFFSERRVKFQLDLALQNNAPGPLFDSGCRLLESVYWFFETYTPEPSLLHGDLWGGNWAADDQDNPVIFDPAVYYGDSEVDIAMTRLFGGFGSEFYAAYDSNRTPDSGAPVRSELYNLYHVLNHFNLFGGGYAAQAESMIDYLLAELS